MIRHVALARLARGGDVVAVAQRQGLGADHPRAPRPAEHAEHDRGRQLARVRAGSRGSRRAAAAPAGPGTRWRAATGPRRRRRRGSRPTCRSPPPAGSRSAPVSSPSTTVERVPTSSWESTSWPVAVVPSRWVAVGPSGSAWPGVVADGSYGAIQGPMIAIEDEEAEDRRADLGLARERAPDAARRPRTRRRRRRPADRRACDGRHQYAALVRVRGSANSRRCRPAGTRAAPTARSPGRCPASAGSRRR